MSELSRCPALLRVVDRIGQENPLQKKRIQTFLAERDPEYWRFAEALSQTLNRGLLSSDEGLNAAARGYNQTCMNLLREQIRFRKSGTYLLSDASHAEEAVYRRDDVMRGYIAGLLLSYLFWPNHYEMFRFFRDEVGRIRAASCLEVGAGHGLFTAEVLRGMPDARVTVVDISAASIQMAREMLSMFEIEPSRVEFLHGDYLETELPAGAFDFIVMGEVLEHVNDPRRFLQKAAALLRPDGTIYLSTCVNCPAPDHVYQFHTVEEIREMVAASGLRVIRELALPAEAVPQERWREELVTINYCAVAALERKA